MFEDLVKKAREDQKRYEKEQQEKIKKLEEKARKDAECDFPMIVAMIKGASAKGKRCCLFSVPSYYEGGMDILYAPFTEIYTTRVLQLINNRHFSIETLSDHRRYICW